VNWTKLACEGLATFLNELPCENYSSPPPQCSLLREKAIDRLCETGRCFFAMIGFVQEELAGRFDHLDSSEDIDLKPLRNRLARVVWEGSANPAGWLAYVKTAVQRATVRALARQRLMPEEKNCGTCALRSKSKPRLCQISGDARKSDDRACDDYHFLPITVTAGAENDADESDDKGATKFFQEAAERSNVTQAHIDTKIDVESVLLELSKRVEREKPGTRRRDRARRQVELVVILLHLAEENYSDGETFKIAAKRMGVCLRTVERDFAAIRDFLFVASDKLGG